MNLHLLFPKETTDHCAFGNLKTRQRSTNKMNNFSNHLKSKQMKNNKPIFFGLLRSTTFSVIATLVLLISSNITIAQYCDTPDQPEIMMMGGGGFGNPDCQNHMNYFPDA
jgi:hypothetical protein